MGAAPLEGLPRDSISLTRKLEDLNGSMISRGIRPADLSTLFDQISASKMVPTCDSGILPKKLIIVVPLSILILAVIVAVYPSGVNFIFGMRCFVPNNYLVWEATRPISDCSFCEGVSRPVILYNMTREKFEKYAYSPGPIIVKGAIKHWKAMEKFTYEMFKDLYEHTSGAYESVENGCQFLHFKSDLFSLREVFSMSENRAKNLDGEQPWYVGWGNCHPEILNTMREYYSYPEFLPEDAELPNTENIFFGYGHGAVMHLDYIPRLMWQGQVKGNKTWTLTPIPECDHVCKSFQFYVEPGDAVILDTRIWYHATYIPPGQFALTVQSEYG